MKIAVPMITAAVQTSSKASTKGRPFCRFTNAGNRIEPTTGPTAATTTNQAPALPRDRPYSVIKVSAAHADKPAAPINDPPAPIHSGRADGTLQLKSGSA